MLEKVHQDSLSSLYTRVRIRNSLIWTKYGEIICISPYSVQMRKNADQFNSECGHFLRSDSLENRSWTVAITFCK